MTSFTFDLISDLNVDSWPNAINWNGLPTSLMAAIIGDISADPNQTIKELKNISRYYQQVLFIDGDLEHTNNYDKVDATQQYFKKELASIGNLIYLYDQVALMNNSLFIGANLWWSVYSHHGSEDLTIDQLHNEDLTHLLHHVRYFQNRRDVENIILLTHTVPDLSLIQEYHDSKKDMIGNYAAELVLQEDITHKIKLWCFGHFPHSIQKRNLQLNFMSNPRGTPNSSTGLSYYPLRILVS